MAQLVECVLGKDEVSSSNLDSSSKSRVTLDTAFCFVIEKVAIASLLKEKPLPESLPLEGKVVQSKLSPL